MSLTLQIPLEFRGYTGKAWFFHSPLLRFPTPKLTVITVRLHLSIYLSICEFSVRSCVGLDTCRLSREIEGKAFEHTSLLLQTFIPV
jgi:hypothetical protein